MELPKDRKNVTLAGGIVISVFLLTTGIVIASYVWSSHNRYHLVGMGGNFVYEVDRLTGKTWFVSPHQKTLVSE